VLVDLIRRHVTVDRQREERRVEVVSQLAAGEGAIEQLQRERRAAGGECCSRTM